MVFGLNNNKMSLGIFIMQNFFQKYKNNSNNYTEIKVKEYLYKYLKELQRHFDLSDKKMRLILYRIYKDTGKLNIFIKLMKKKLSMLKSKYRKRRIKNGT